MTLTVGHNDPGYLPDSPPVEVATLHAAIAELKALLLSYFQIELDDVELTANDIRAFQQRVFHARPGSTYIFHGHAFWIQ